MESNRGGFGGRGGNSGGGGFTKKPVCKWFVQGTCNKGNSCNFYHPKNLIPEAAFGGGSGPHARGGYHGKY